MRKAKREFFRFECVLSVWLKNFSESLAPNFESPKTAAVFLISEVALLLAERSQLRAKPLAKYTVRAKR